MIKKLFTFLRRPPDQHRDIYFTRIAGSVITVTQLVLLALLLFSGSQGQLELLLPSVVFCFLVATSTLTLLRAVTMSKAAFAFVCSSLTVLGLCGVFPVAWTWRAATEALCIVVKEYLESPNCDSLLRARTTLFFCTLANIVICLGWSVTLVLLIRRLKRISTVKIQERRARALRRMEIHRRRVENALRTKEKERKQLKEQIQTGAH